jgi:hypothetical protein
MLWAGSVITDTTTGNYDDPNITQPDTTTAKATGSQPCEYTGFGASPLSLVLATRGPNTSTWTVNVWASYSGDENTRQWVKFAEGIVVTEGTPQFVRIPPHAHIYVQVTATANTPTHLIVGQVPY